MSARRSDRPRTKAYLQIPLAEAEAELKSRVIKGRQILKAFKASGGGDLKSIAAQEDSWHKSAHRWLLLRISEGEGHPALSFELLRTHPIRSALEGSSGSMLWTRPPLTMPKEVESLEKRVRYLGDILDDLALYVPSSGGSNAQGPHDMPDRPPGGHYNITIHNASQVNVQPGAVANIESSLQAINNQGNPELADALERFAEAALNDPDLEDDQRADLARQVEELAKEVAAPSAQRRPWKIKACVAAIPQITASATAALQLWHQVEPMVQQLLGQH